MRTQLQVGEDEEESRANAECTVSKGVNGGGLKEGDAAGLHLPALAGLSKRVYVNLECFPASMRLT